MTSKTREELLRIDEDITGQEVHILENIHYQELVRSSMTPRPIVCLCGSCRNEESYRIIAEEFSLSGSIVLDPEVWDRWEELHSEQGVSVKEQLDALHFSKIRMSDFVYVTDDGSGESTSREIRFALELNIPVYARERCEYKWVRGNLSPKQALASWIEDKSKSWKGVKRADNLG